MAFKMKNNPFKQSTDGQEENPPSESYLDYKERMSEKEEIDKIYKQFDIDGEVGLNDEERNAFIKAMGLTNEQVSDEMNRLAEMYGDDDHDEGQYIAAVLALSKKNKSMKSDSQMKLQGHTKPSLPLPPLSTPGKI